MDSSFGGRASSNGVWILSEVVSQSSTHSALSTSLYKTSIIQMTHCHSRPTMYIVYMCMYIRNPGGKEFFKD